MQRWTTADEVSLAPSSMRIQPTWNRPRPTGHSHALESV